MLRKSFCNMCVASWPLFDRPFIVARARLITRYALKQLTRWVSQRNYDKPPPKNFTAPNFIPFSEAEDLESCAMMAFGFLFSHNLSLWNKGSSPGISCSAHCGWLEKGQKKAAAELRWSWPCLKWSSSCENSVNLTMQKSPGSKKYNYHPLRRPNSSSSSANILKQGNNKVCINYQIFPKTSVLLWEKRWLEN